MFLLSLLTPFRVTVADITAVAEDMVEDMVGDGEMMTECLTLGAVFGRLTGLTPAWKGSKRTSMSKTNESPLVQNGKLKTFDAAKRSRFKVVMCHDLSPALKKLDFPSI